MFLLSFHLSFQARRPKKEETRPQCGSVKETEEDHALIQPIAGPTADQATASATMMDRERQRIEGARREAQGIAQREAPTQRQRLHAPTKAAGTRRRTMRSASV